MGPSFQAPGLYKFYFHFHAPKDDAVLIYWIRGPTSLSLNCFRIFTGYFAVEHCILVLVSFFLRYALLVLRRYRFYFFSKQSLSSLSLLMVLYESRLKQEKKNLVT